MKYLSICKISLSTAVFALLINSPVLRAYSGGNGNSDNPYQIAGVADLQQFSTDYDNEDKCFSLTSDIDMTGIPWTPVYTFSGTFDGQGYTISNLTITQYITATVYTGFIEELLSGGKVTDLILIDIDFQITGTKDIEAGGLVGVNNGTIERCGTTGQILAISIGTGDIFSVVCGGLVGDNDDTGQIKQCFSAVNVSTVVVDDPSEDIYNETGAGGLVGDNDFLIEDSFAMGDVKAFYDDAYAGGFVAWNDNTGIIRRCYSIGNAYSYSTIYSEYEGGGGFAEMNDCGTIEDCFYNIETSGNDAGVLWDWCENSDVTPITSAQMSQKSTFTDAGWDFLFTWEMSPESSLFGGVPVQKWIGIEDQELFNISGTVTDKETGLPLENIWIGCWHGDEGIWFNAWTNSDGFYEFTEMPQGELEVQALPQPPSNYARTGKELYLDEDVNGLDFALGAGAAYQGRVIDAVTAQPLAGIEVNYWSDMSTVWQNSWTDDDGSFILTNLPPGVAVITVRPEVDSGYAWSSSYESAWVYLDEGREYSNRFIALQKGALVYGYIVNSDGTPASGIEFDYEGRACGGRGQAGPEGYYEIILPPGNYIIGPDNEEFGVLYGRVTVTDIDTPYSVADIKVYSADTGGEISGTINNPGDHARTGDFLIVAFEAGTEFGPDTWYTLRPVMVVDLTDTGPFTLSALPPGNYDIYLIVVSETPEEIESLAIRDLKLNVPVGATDVSLNYNSQGGTVRGVVINTDGGAVLGATLLLTDSATGEQFAGFGDVDKNGRYVIYNVPAGTYRATSVHGKYLDISTTVEVVDGAVLNVETIIVPFVGQKEGPDLNGDGIVDFNDVVQFTEQWLQSGTLTGDFSQDENINLEDWAKVAQNWLWKTTWRTEVIDTGIVGFWKMNETDVGAGSIIADSSGNANDGIANDAMTSVDGVIGGALKFDGIDDYVDIADNSTLDMTTAMTVSLWVKQPVLAIRKALVAKWDYPTQGSWALQTAPGYPDELILYIATALDDDGAGCNIRTTGADIVAGNWYHVAFVYDGTGAVDADRLKIYVDGEEQILSLKGTVPSSLQNSDASVKIGEFGGTVHRYFNGTIDEVRIYNRALSQAELQ